MPRTSGTRIGNGAGHGASRHGCGKPSRGDGWGGPARGTGTRPALEPGNPGGRMSNDPEAKARAAARAAALNDHLYDLALNADRQETQLTATIAALNRLEGQPVQRAVLATVGDPSKLSDAELLNLIETEQARLAMPDGVETKH